MKTYSFDEARAKLATLVDDALAGEPQRVVLGGNEAVVIVSENAWHCRPAPTLGALLARYARSGLMRRRITARSWNDRPLHTVFD